MFTLVKTMIFVFAIQKTPWLYVFYMYLRGPVSFPPSHTSPKKRLPSSSTKYGMIMVFVVCTVNLFYQTMLGYYSYMAILPMLIYCLDGG